MKRPSLATDWSGYEVFDPGPDVDRPLHELSRPIARAAYDRLMDTRLERIDQLRRLCRDNNVDIDASDGLQRLNDWFLQAVEPSEDDGTRLANQWYSVVNDIGLFLGERAIAASGGKLHWEFFTWGKSDAAYQRHVIMGFDLPNPKFNVDFDLRVAQYAHRIVKGAEVEPDFFNRLLEKALSKINR